MPTIRPRPLLMLLTAMLTLPALGEGQGADASVTLEALLLRAGGYIRRFTTDFANVVAEERYIQRTSGRQTVDRTLGRAGPVMGNEPSRFSDCGPRCPVENISFADVQRFLAKLNARSTPEVRFRLPTEAEWEYACRAGGASPFSTGANITTAQANYDGRRPYDSSAPGVFRGRPTAAGSFDSNPWGIGDMHANVWEWTADWYGPYSTGSSIDPPGPPSGDKRSVRGGSWDTGARDARCAMRNSYPPEHRSPGIGFRVAADLVPSS